MTTFCKLPRADFDSLVGASIAVFGASEASPYKLDVPSHSANAPNALRLASLVFAGQLRQFDFDLQTCLFGANGETRGMVDCGDVATDRNDAEGNRERIRKATQAVRTVGAKPVILGGDDSVPIPWFAGFEAAAPIPCCR